MDTEEKEIEYISLRTDLLFHMVFSRNEKALKSLLSALLHIPVATIGKVDILNPMQYSEAADSKLTVLDLKLHLGGGRYVIVEMQVRKFEFWTNRTVAYACRQVADQVVGEFDYSKLEQVVQVSIMDHTLFPDHKKFFAEYAIKDEEGYLYSDKLKFMVMDLTAVDAASDEQKKQGLVEWAKAFSADSWDEVNGIENPGVKEVAKTMEAIMSNPIEREWIRMRRDAEIDRRTEMVSVRMSEKRETAQKMKAKGYPIEDISELTELSIADIKKL